MENKNVIKGITPEVLQELFIDYARELCAEELGCIKESSSFKEHSQDAYDEYRCWFNALFECELHKKSLATFQSRGISYQISSNKKSTPQGAS